MRHQEVQIGFEWAAIDSERTGRMRIPGRLNRRIRLRRESMAARTRRVAL